MNDKTTSALRRTCVRCKREIQPFETCFFITPLDYEEGPMYNACQRIIIRAEEAESGNEV